jgi:hypothetical protein
MQPLKDLCIAKVLKDGLVLKLLRSADITADLKQKIAVLIIENWILDVSFNRVNQRLPSGIPHGIIRIRSSNPNTIDEDATLFFWFGRAYGPHVTSTTLHFDCVHWFVNDLREGPSVYAKNGAFLCKLYSKGEKVGVTIVLCNGLAVKFQIHRTLYEHKSNNYVADRAACKIRDMHHSTKVSEIQQ